jgi:hypothetical protein
MVSELAVEEIVTDRKPSNITSGTVQAVKGE